MNRRSFALLILTYVFRIYTCALFFSVRLSVLFIRFGTISKETKKRNK